MVFGFAVGFLVGSIATFFLVRGRKRAYHSTMEDIDQGLARLRQMIKDMERDS